MPSNPGHNATSTPAVDAVIFDLGGVLFDWSPYHLYRKLLPTDAEIEAFLNEVRLYEALLDLDLGMPFPEWTDRLAKRHPERTEHIEAYRHRWQETVAGVFDETIEVIDAIHAAGIPLYVISNWAADLWQATRESMELPFLESFTGIVISGEVGLVKPHADIFNLTCQRYGLTPKRSAFIDDNATNVAAASGLGFQAIQFHGSEGADALKSRLSGLGLKLD